MGWNDRLPEDPNIPYESTIDSDDYENWQLYISYLRAEEEAAAGLTSNNIQPGDLPALPTHEKENPVGLRRVEKPDDIITHS